MPLEGGHDALADEPIDRESRCVVRAGRLPATARGAHVWLTLRHGDRPAVARGHVRLIGIFFIDAEIFLRDCDLVGQEPLVQVAYVPHTEITEVNLADRAILVLINGETMQGR